MKKTRLWNRMVKLSLALATSLTVGYVNPMIWPFPYEDAVKNMLEEKKQYLGQIEREFSTYVSDDTLDLDELLSLFNQIHSLRRSGGFGPDPSFLELFSASALHEIRARMEMTSVILAREEMAALEIQLGKTVYKNLNSTGVGFEHWYDQFRLPLISHGQDRKKSSHLEPNHAYLEHMVATNLDKFRIYLHDHCEKDVLESLVIPHSKNNRSRNILLGLGVGYLIGLGLMKRYSKST